MDSDSRLRNSRTTVKWIGIPVFQMDSDPETWKSITVSDSGRTRCQPKSVPVSEDIHEQNMNKNIGEIILRGPKQLKWNRDISILSQIY